MRLPFKDIDIMLGLDEIIRADVDVLELGDYSELLLLNFRINKAIRTETKSLKTKSRI